MRTSIRVQTQPCDIMNIIWPYSIYSFFTHKLWWLRKTYFFQTTWGSFLSCPAWSSHRPSTSVLGFTVLLDVFAPKSVKLHSSEHLWTLVVCTQQMTRTTPKQSSPELMITSSRFRGALVGISRRRTGTPCQIADCGRAVAKPGGRGGHHGFMRNLETARVIFMEYHIPYHLGYFQYRWIMDAHHHGYGDDWGFLLT